MRGLGAGGCGASTQRMQSQRNGQQVQSAMHSDDMGRMVSNNAKAGRKEVAREMQAMSCVSQYALDCLPRSLQRPIPLRNTRLQGEDT